MFEYHSQFFRPHFQADFIQWVSWWRNSLLFHSLSLSDSLSAQRERELSFLSPSSLHAFPFQAIRACLGCQVLFGWSRRLLGNAMWPKMAKIAFFFFVHILQQMLLYWFTWQVLCFKNEPKNGDFSLVTLNDRQKAVYIPDHLINDWSVILWRLKEFNPNGWNIQ